jgi:OFA family oxalate/formate antiporter-like MFS transporter
MIPGGRIQDKFGPKVGATIGGLSLAFGCFIAGYMSSFQGLIIGFGIFGGIGMGIGYAAPTPAALKWFGPHKRGLIAGLVVGGYGGAALYIAPWAKEIIDVGVFGFKGVSGSFYLLGIWFALVTIVAGQLLKWPDPGYVPPPAPVKAGAAPVKAVGTTVDWAPGEIIKVGQFLALVLMFVGTAQSGLLVIANAAPIMGLSGLAALGAWLASFGGAVNAFGRVGTGLYSDKIGRSNAYALNCIVAAICLVFTPAAIRLGNPVLLFLLIGVAYWQYGGGLALMPAFTADFFGPKNLGMNYGLVFIGWGIAFFVPLLAGYHIDYMKSLGPDYAKYIYDYSFYVSAVFLIITVIISRITRRPIHAAE